MALNIRPSMFVGSSGEAHRIAQEVQVLLDSVCEVELWSQGLFEPTQSTLESLVSALDRFDFAVFILAPDDSLTTRGTERAVPRDNVIFELGLFVGALGRERTFMLYDKTRVPSLPSDLAGVTAVTYQPHSSGNTQAALGAACTRIQKAVEMLGVRESQRAHRLAQATNSAARLEAGILSFMNNRGQFPAPAGIVFGEAKSIVRRMKVETDALTRIRDEIERRKREDNNWTFANQLNEALALVNALGLAPETAQENDVFLQMQLPEVTKGRQTPE